MIKPTLAVCLLAAAFAALPGLVFGQSVTRLKNQPPDGAIMTFQLTDGTVLAQGGSDSDWYVLTPDNTGSYVNGTWAKVGSLPTGYSPYAMASRVLADGRDYYTLSYVSKDSKMDGKFRAITIRLRDSKLVVRAKRGYWATEE